MSSSILLLGASIRAAAFSARRADLQPWGADLFLDADLALAGTLFQRIADSKTFLAISELGPPGPFLYTGALENRPRLIEEIARRRPLWGNSAKVLRQVRSPQAVFQVLRDAGIPCPRVDATRSAESVGWLQKPKGGAGGKGITNWTGQPIRRGHYLQEFIEGEPCAAVFVADQGKAELLGVTRQLVGQAWLHAGPFQYCGSIGPLVLQAKLQQALVRLGNALAAGFQLQGLFGVDCIVRDNIPWPVEINPRYTASVEVLELATGTAVLLEHAKVFDSSFAACVSRPENPTRPRIASIIGKAIVFAQSPLNFPQEGPWPQSLSPREDFWTMPAFADIPVAGQSIPIHQPILTLFAGGDRVAECENRLHQTVADLDRLLFPS